MITIKCTKKLLNELKMDIDKKIISISPPIYSWHSHLFLINRRKCVIVMNSKTRFNFILFGLKKADFLKFDSIVVNAIAENLLAEEIDVSVVERYLEECNRVIYTTSSDRCIISQMSEMKRFAEYIFNDNKSEGIETDIYKLNRQLNSFVMTKLPDLYSGVTMKNELIKLYSNEK